MIKVDKSLILALTVFFLLTLPFINSIPYLDGNIDFVKAVDFFSGGFNQLLSNWLSVHPPTKEILVFVFFLIGGINPISYNLLGVLAGLFGLIIFYKLANLITNKPTARIAVLLLSSSPLFISAGLFSNTDYLLEIFLLAALYFYATKKFWPYFIFTSLALLTKETGLIIIPAILISQSLQKTGWKQWLKLLSPIVPILLWFLFLKAMGKGPWSDWNFSGTGDQGTLYTIINNLVTLKIFNKYAFQNWLQVFVLNFNWVFWCLTLVSGFTYRIKIIKNKILLVLLVFSVVYFISVLSFQTYSIPRYALPLEPLFFLAVASGIYSIRKRFRALGIVVYSIVSGVILLRLFTSLDPISTGIWGKTQVLGQSLYALNQAPSLSGFDGLTYNLQYNLLVQKRTRIIRGLTANDNCSWIFPDPNNDSQTISILHLEKIPCYLQDGNQ